MPGHTFCGQVPGSFVQEEMMLETLYSAEAQDFVFTFVILPSGHF